MESWQSLVYCTCLENRRTEMFREFESHTLRQIYPISEMNITLCYERRGGGLIPSLGAKEDGQDGNAADC